MTINDYLKILLDAKDQLGGDTEASLPCDFYVWEYVAEEDRAVFY